MSFGVTTLNSPLVFVDIETNGLNHVRGRVIEVAAIRVEHGKVVRSFRSLVDPQTELPLYITRLTGIAHNDLKGAPMFDQIADELRETLEGAIFVAHNVRFDYSFLKQEFGRLGMSFLPKQLCTVKLSRALYPHERGHKLEDVIRRHGFTFSARHRAYDDAAVLWQFLQYVTKHFPPEQIETALRMQIKQPALPKSLQPALVRDLPDGPGVYIFEDEASRPLYVGKSVTIKKRVLSHFSRDHAESKEFKISQTIANIRAIETDGELAALMLESRLIKELQPLYNRQLRRTAKLVLAKQKVHQNGYVGVELHEANEILPTEASDILAVYTRRGKAKDSLEELARTHYLCPKLLGLEKASGACFWFQLKKCNGACAGLEAPQAYNARLLNAFERKRIRDWPYKGPVLVQEKVATATERAIVVDQWCVIGELSQEAHCEPLLSARSKVFDLDTYKILQSFLSSKISTLNVRPISVEQLRALAS